MFASEGLVAYADMCLRMLTCVCLLMPTCALAFAVPTCVCACVCVFRSDGQDRLMSPAVKGSKIMASPMRMRTATADSAMVGDVAIAVSGSFVLCLVVTFILGRT